MSGTQRVTLTPAYVLHHHDYRDSSRIVEVFAREYGRLSLFARGARGAKSSLRATLQPFQPLLVSFSGRSEAGQLTGAELAAPVSQLPAQRLMSGFYLNELLMRLTERWDPHPALFDAYAEAIGALAEPALEQICLRRFEKRLLEELGYGLDLMRTDRGEPIVGDRHYRVRAQGGVTRCEPDAPDAVPGSSLLDLEREDLLDPQALRDAKRILRTALDACLEGRPLATREVMIALHRQETG